MLHDHFKANLQNLTDWAQQAQSWPARQKTSRRPSVLQLIMLLPTLWAEQLLS